MTTKTVAAMHREGAGRDQQHAALVFVDQSGLADLAEIADRIDDVAGARLTFAQRRPDLQELRIERIALAHPRREAARHPQRKVAQGFEAKASGDRKSTRLNSSH